MFTHPLFDFLELGATQAFLEDMTVYLETLSVNGAFTTPSKHTTQSPLPKVYAGQDPELASDPAGYRAFYSGHVSTVFSALSAASMAPTYRHGFSPWP